MERNIGKWPVSLPSPLCRDTITTNQSSHIFMLLSTSCSADCSGGCAVKQSFSKDFSVTWEIAHIRRSTPWSVALGNEHQCINTFNSQYLLVHYHSVLGAYIIQLLTSLKATCPYFSSCQKLAMKIFISNLTILRIFQIILSIQTNGKITQ